MPKITILLLTKVSFGVPFVKVVGASGTVYATAKYNNDKDFRCHVASIPLEVWQKPGFRGIIPSKDISETFERQPNPIWEIRVKVEEGELNPTLNDNSEPKDSVLTGGSVTTESILVIASPLDAPKEIIVAEAPIQEATAATVEQAVVTPVVPVTDEFNVPFPTLRTIAARAGVPAVLKLDRQGLIDAILATRNSQLGNERTERQ